MGVWTEEAGVQREKKFELEEKKVNTFVRRVDLSVIMAAMLV